MLHCSVMTSCAFGTGPRMRQHSPLLHVTAHCVCTNYPGLIHCTLYRFNALHIVLPWFNALHIILPVSIHYLVSMHCNEYKLSCFNAMHNALLRFNAFCTTPSPAVLPCLLRSTAPCSLHDTAAIYNVAELLCSVLNNISCQHSFTECKQ